MGMNIGEEKINGIYISNKLAKNVYIGNKVVWGKTLKLTFSGAGAEQIRTYSIFADGIEIATEDSPTSGRSYVVPFGATIQCHIQARVDYYVKYNEKESADGGNINLDFIALEDMVINIEVLSMKTLTISVPQNFDTLSYITIKYRRPQSDWTQKQFSKDAIQNNEIVLHEDTEYYMYEVKINNEDYEFANSSSWGTEENPITLTENETKELLIEGKYEVTVVATAEGELLNRPFRLAVNKGNEDTKYYFDVQSVKVRFGSETVYIVPMPFNGYTYSSCQWIALNPPAEPVFSPVNGLKLPKFSGTLRLWYTSPATS